MAGKKFTTTVPVDEFELFDKSNFIDSNIVVDGNIITAKANGYVDFALELVSEMNIFEDDEDYQEKIRFFKNFKDS